MVRWHMITVQEEQARLYNRGVMVLVPTTESKFLVKWHGPYEIAEKVGPAN